MPDMGLSVASLDSEEQQAMDDLFAVYSRILRWGLQANQAELTMAIHMIQGFITQRMLHRIAPDQWSSWYEMPAVSESAGRA